MITSFFPGIMGLSLILLGSEKCYAEVGQAPALGQITLALKYVEFVDDSSSSILNETGVKGVVREINTIYSQCGINFLLGEYSAIKPGVVGLPVMPESLKEMWNFRRPFEDSRFLVVVKTGKWDHKKMGSPNAWTAMPGETPAGVVLESSVASFAGILAHELGHYLDLHHVENSVNLMNPLIFRSSIQLTSIQCSKMRSTAVFVHSPAIRSSGSASGESADSPISPISPSENLPVAIPPGNRG